MWKIWKTSFRSAPLSINPSFQPPTGLFLGNFKFLQEEEVWRCKTIEKGLEAEAAAEGDLILHHKASELNLNMRSDGFVKVEDLLKLNMKTFANVPLRSHTDDDVKETVESESQKQFFRPRKLQVMRWDVDVLIFLDVRKALEGININTSNLFN
ncbi:hypothetical protein D5086_024717 [Populus alba]|uniref:Uncharacterized protein n=1 Tax=Populus alba TaxID=43335 RepID=A0ACC4B7V4_POPAL